MDATQWCAIRAHITGRHLGIGWIIDPAYKPHAFYHERNTPVVSRMY